MLAVPCRGGTENGDVYTCGYNDSGQCGVVTTNRLMELTLVRALRGRDVVTVHSSNGCEHLLCVSDDGALYSCGYNARGQLGHGDIHLAMTPRYRRRGLV